MENSSDKNKEKKKRIDMIEDLIVIPLLVFLLFINYKYKCFGDSNWTIAAVCILVGYLLAPYIFKKFFSNKNK